MDFKHCEHCTKEIRGYYVTFIEIRRIYFCDEGCMHYYLEKKSLIKIPGFLSANHKPILGEED